jgi:tetratricopeptide (TPR) repeat protein
MPTVGRNEQCPCGSGRKYKKCCLAKDEREAAAHRAPPPGAAAPSAAAGQRFLDEDDGLEELSNSVIDLIRERRFDEALAACKRLQEEFPEVVDWLERAAMVYAAMGDHAVAADYYRKALEFITHPSRRGDYEGAEYYSEQIEKQERLAGRR